MRSFILILSLSLLSAFSSAQAFQCETTLTCGNIDGTYTILDGECDIIVNDDEATCTGRQYCKEDGGLDAEGNQILGAVVESERCHNTAVSGEAQPESFEPFIFEF